MLPNLKMCPISKSLLVILLIVTIVSAAATDSLDQETGGRKGTNHPNEGQLEFLTIVNGKAYFTKDISKSWIEASDYCIAFDMELGTIETHSEWEELSTRLATFPGGGVWTAARESRKPQMYAWNNTEVPLDPSVVRGWDDRYVRDHDYHYCVVFYSYPSLNYPTGMYPVPCRNKQKILCQDILTN